ncbi:MAG: preprotein translocase subunit SecE [Acidimicrobiaceae bacterium]|jgi:preprotein translocase subunit SecE|nr:preprotein translocase subunit SecE [Acidimicrobiaceae bacterium]|tara:strand:+ start:388 stop:699 length:312 start_codon:yes stop_codon:yes gene_type:complete
MAMNRQTRRHLQKQGEMSADGAPIANRDRRGPAAGNPSDTERAGPTQFAREVKGELRKVVWPTKDEIINYSVVVFFTIVVLTALIAGLDYLTGEGVLRLFDVN